MKAMLPEWFVAGGPVMWPILACSLLTLLVAIEKLWTLRRRVVLQPEVTAVVSALVHAGQLDEAAAHCERHPGPYAGIAAAALAVADQDPDAIRQAAVDAGRQEEARLLRRLTIVRTVAAVAPLLGLFGTVMGMIAVFKVITEAGALGQASALSDGIHEALLTTAFGLAVAVPSLIIHEAFRSRVDRLLLHVEHEVLMLVGLLARRAGNGVRAAAPGPATSPRSGDAATASAATGTAAAAPTAAGP